MWYLNEEGGQAGVRGQTGGPGGLVKGEGGKRKKTSINSNNKSQQQNLKFLSYSTTATI